LPARHRVRDGVTGCADHRQSGPEVIEHTRTEREARLHVVKVCGDPYIGVEQPVRACLIRYPRVVEEHEAVGEVELIRKTPGFGYRPHQLIDAGLGMRTTHENQTQAWVAVRQTAHGADENCRIEPVVHAATPEQ